MPLKCGKGGKRSDVKHMAKCGAYTLYYCRMYCRSDDGRLTREMMRCSYKNKTYKDNIAGKIEGIKQR